MYGIDWELVGVWIGALATTGLLIIGIVGLKTWRTQFIKRRDHDLAVRIVNAISNSHIVFDELRAPIQLFSDSDVPVPPPAADGPDPWYQHRVMFARYKARNMHLSDARAERSAPLFEALAIWVDEEFAVELGHRINALAPIEDRVISESIKYVDSLRPDYDQRDGERIDRAFLYSPQDADADDPLGKEFEDARNRILEHLQSKLRMV